MHPHMNTAATRLSGAPDAQALELLARAAVDGRRVLLKGGTIVTMDPALGNLVGDVLITGTTIARVGHRLDEAVGDDVITIDATGTIVLPGFVDSHLHAWQGQLRGLAPVIDFETYMKLTHERLAQHYRPDDMYIGKPRHLPAVSGCGSDHNPRQLTQRP